MKFEEKTYELEGRLQPNHRLDIVKRTNVAVYRIYLIAQMLNKLI